MHSESTFLCQPRKIALISYRHPEKNYSNYFVKFHFKDFALHFHAYAEASYGGFQEMINGSLGEMR